VQNSCFTSFLSSRASLPSSVLVLQFLPNHSWTLWAICSRSSSLTSSSSSLVRSWVRSWACPPPETRPDLRHLPCDFPVIVCEYTLFTLFTARLQRYRLSKHSLHTLTYRSRSWVRSYRAGWDRTPAAPLCLRGHTRLRRGSCRPCGPASTS